MRERKGRMVRIILRLSNMYTPLFNKYYEDDQITENVNSWERHEEDEK
jgi:hypothetical protein